MIGSLYMRGPQLDEIRQVWTGFRRADKEDQEQGPDDVTEEERDDMHMRAALNMFMSNRFSDSLPDSTLLGISGAELRELLGGAD